MKINDALNEIERLQKELAAAKLIIALQKKIIKNRTTTKPRKRPKHVKLIPLNLQKQ